MLAHTLFEQTLLLVGKIVRAEHVAHKNVRITRNFFSRVAPSYLETGGVSAPIYQQTIQGERKN